MEKDILKADPVVEAKLEEVGQGYAVATLASHRGGAVQIVHAEDVIAGAEAMTSVVIRQ